MLSKIYEQLSSTEYQTLNSHLLYGEIDDTIIEKACQWVIDANLESKHPNLHLIINSSGGSLTSAWSLIDFMATSQIPVSTYGLGQSASAGLLLLMSGAKGSRFASENLSLMSHQFEGGYDDSYHNINSMQVELINTHQRYLNHYVKCTGLSEKKVNKKLLSPTNKWLTANEALEYNLIDTIFTI
jgi:ATP-dependent Clp protease protease subunit